MRFSLPINKLDKKFYIAYFSESSNSNSLISVIIVFTKIYKSDSVNLYGGGRDLDNNESILSKDQKDFIDKLGFYYESYGIPRIGGRILGYILLCDSPVSAEHISSALSISRASVSTNLRLLMNCGFIEKKMLQQGRTDFYAMAESAWENALTARINGFHSLMNILDTDSLSTDNSSMNEMREWCQLMYSIHEKARDEWKKRR